MKITIKNIDQAAKKLEGVAQKTPLQYSKRLSNIFKANIYFKREDLQEVRSFKIRGAYNKMCSLTSAEKKRGVVTASAGNHAQGVAFSCSTLKIKGTIFMPVVTPNQKIEKVKHFSGGYVDIRLVGNTFDEASLASQLFCEEQHAIFVHPFDDPHTIAGQGTVAKEIYDELEGKVDYVLVCIGGGGLISGIATYLKEKSKKIQIIGVEPGGAAGMHKSLTNGKVTTLDTIDTFVDGAAVKTVGQLTYDTCKKNVAKIITVPEGKVCMVMVDLYQNEGIVAEPAGAVSISGLSEIRDEIKGKTVVCVLSGGNNDILRYPEIMEKSLTYQGRKHYFVIEFAQKPGQLRNFLDNALGPNDDIVRFEYIKKTNKEKGPALVGIELKDKKDFKPLVERMKKIELNFREISSRDLMYHYLV